MTPLVDWVYAAKQLGVYAIMGVAMALLAGGITFLSDPLGAAFIVLWLLWGVAIASGRGRGEALIHEKKQHSIVALSGLLSFPLMILAPWEHVTFGGPLPRDGFVPWVGILLFAIGVGLQWWSLRELGSFYTTHLGIQEGHRLVTSGPYSLVRHPGYLSSFMVLAGMALSLGSLCVIAATFVSTAVMIWRIGGEEEMLVEAFGDEYREYQRRTRRLLPRIW
jgi:protein-S-isoprenylcysteine O-methyltransferase Ste14